MRIYVAKMDELFGWAVCALLSWGTLRVVSERRPAWRRAFAAASVLLAMVALYGILAYTVLGRTPSDSHQFVWYSYAHGEYVREMFMNALLYVPLGATLGGVVGLWSVPVGLALSAGVEAWQYQAGTGLAQGTDVLFNVVGCAVGALSLPLVARVLRAVRESQAGAERG